MIAVQELASPHRAVPGRRRARVHHRQRRQRRRRHRDLFGRRRAVRLLAAVDDDPDHDRAGGRPGDVVAHGRGHRQGAERPHPRGIRLARDVPADARARRHQLRQRRSAEFAGVASSLELFGVSKYIVVPLAAFDRLGLVVHGTYSSVEKIFLSASGFYVATSSSGVLAHPDWKAAALVDGDAAARASASATTATCHDHRPGRHDDRAVDAVLPAGVDRREGRDDAAVHARRAGTSSSAACSPRSSRGSSSSRARRRCTRSGKYRHRDAAPTRRRRCGRSPASTRTCCLPPGCSTRRCSRRRSCRSRRPTRSARGWGSSRGSTRRFDEAPAFYWLYTLIDRRSAPACCWCRGSRSFAHHGAVAGRQRHRCCRSC